MSDPRNPYGPLIRELAEEMNTPKAMTDPTDEVLRVRLAELTGWENVHAADRAWQEHVGELVGIPKGTLGYRLVPNYPACLNACHEVEKGLTSQQTHDYHALLLTCEKPSPTDVRDGRAAPSERWTWHATARQRAIALIEVLEKARIERGKEK